MTQTQRKRFRHGGEIGRQSPTCTQEVRDRDQGKVGQKQTKKGKTELETKRSREREVDSRRGIEGEEHTEANKKERNRAK